MRAIQLFILALTLLYIQPTLGQDYREYQKTFNSIDDDIERMEMNVAIRRLDSIYNQYQFIYARHCFKALQICVTQNDSLRADQWLEKALLQGVPMWMIRNNNIAMQALHYQNTQHTVEHSDDLHAAYHSSINDSLAKVIDSLLAIDQHITHKVNNGFIVSRGLTDLFRWKWNNKLSFRAIDVITKEYGFPGEQLIGLPDNLLDSAQAYKHFFLYGPQTLKDHRAYTMLIHYFSDKRPPIDSSLYNNVVSGHLPAYQYGGLNDFRSKYGKADNYYNVWHKTKENIEAVNQRRHAIGLNDYYLQQRIMESNIRRRKEKTINSIIMMESN